MGQLELSLHFFFGLMFDNAKGKNSKYQIFELLLNVKEICKNGWLRMLLIEAVNYSLKWSHLIFNNLRDAKKNEQIT